MEIITKKRKRKRLTFYQEEFSQTRIAQKSSTLGNSSRFHRTYDHHIHHHVITPLFFVFVFLYPRIKSTFQQKPGINSNDSFPDPIIIRSVLFHLKLHSVQSHAHAVTEKLSLVRSICTDGLIIVFNLVFRLVI